MAKLSKAPLSPEDEYGLDFETAIATLIEAKKITLADLKEAGITLDSKEESGLQAQAGFNPNFLNQRVNLEEEERIKADYKGDRHGYFLLANAAQEEDAEVIADYKKREAAYLWLYAGLLFYQRKITPQLLARNNIRVTEDQVCGLLETKYVQKLIDHGLLEDRLGDVVDKLTEQFKERLLLAFEAAQTTRES